MSVYTRATLGTSANQIVFNDYTLDPVFRVMARAPSKWQIRQQDLPVPFESGDSDFLTLLGSAAYILSGKMYPASEGSYDSGLAALRTVCSLDIEQADLLSDTGYVPYKWGDAGGNLTKQVFMKPLYVQLAETTKQGFVQPFTIYAKIKDPTIFSGTIKTASTQQANFSQSTGSFVLPVAFPVVIGATLFTVSSNAQNLGTLPTYPVSIQVHGPVNTPRITNTTTGEYIEVAVNLTTTNDILTISYDKDTFSIDLNGTSKIQNLSTASTLFKIRPGGNVITLTGSSVSTGAYASLTYYDAWPLS